MQFAQLQFRNMMSTPTAFISYSHDSQEHKQWVLDLALRLRGTGIDASLDQWDLAPGNDLAHFMEQRIASSDRILMICTERYVGKANAGSGGVGYEKMIVTAALLQNIDSKKIIPIVRQTAGQPLLPTFLSSKLYIDLSSQDQFEANFDNLLRELHNAPLFKKPALGANPFASVADIPAERNGDAAHVLIKLLANKYNKDGGGLGYLTALKDSGMSRIMFEFITNTASDEKLISSFANRENVIVLSLTELGKQFARRHKISE
jgi:hypothetical protein